MTTTTIYSGLVTALATAFVAVSSTASLAADVAGRTYKAPALASIYNWSGFYIGGQVGAASMSASFKDLGDEFDNEGLNPDRSTKFTGGGYGGYNWQMGSFVVGVDAQWSAYGNQLTSTPDQGASDFISTKLNDAGSVKVRFGLAFTDTLVYVAAGPSWANMTLSTFNAGSGSGSNKKAVGGIAAAVGVEHLITPNWILRGQIQYAEYDAHNADFGPGNSFRLGQQSSVLEATAGISYKFGPLW